MTMTLARGLNGAQRRGETAVVKRWQQVDVTYSGDATLLVLGVIVGVRALSAGTPVAERPLH